MRILIANRGEIARRIIRTARTLGSETVAVFADPDREAPFVSEATHSLRIGPADVGQSYLSIPRVIAAAEETSATAVHPGYGFLSENPDFATAVVEAGLLWIGPSPETIRLMGSKIEARRVAGSAGMPTVPGFDSSQDADAFAGAATEIGFPVLLKASAGGGGRGIRIVLSAADLLPSVEAARSEAEVAFGDGSLVLEKYIQQPRHIEVQIVGDSHGDAIHLGTRECSLQRRYQKILEEAPAPNISAQLRSTMESSAVELARAVGYDSVGTVEFILDDETGEHYFLEMNPRLQVEHPVSEAISGLDLVALQITVATGEPLGLAQSDVALAGHGFEARINAEDPWDGYTPQVGRISSVVVPEGVRWDSGVEAGDEVTPHYDATIAKLIVAGPTRADALRKLASALDDLVVGGIVTNTGLHRWLVDQPAVVEGRVTTRFLDGAVLPERPSLADAARLAAAAWVQERGRVAPSDVWHSRGPFRTTPYSPARTVFLEDLGGARHSVVVGEPTPGLGPMAVDTARRCVDVALDGHTLSYRVVSRSEFWAPEAAVGHGSAGAIVSPFPAVVTEILVRSGDPVTAGETVVVIEAMKMLHSLSASGAGVVEEIRVAAGEQVASQQILITFAA